MEYPKLPKLTREQNRGCKMSDSGIKILRKMHKNGISYASIGEHFSVSASAVRYWCWSKEKRQDVNKRHKDNCSTEQQRKNYKRHIDYKYSVLGPDLLKDFFRETSKVFRSSRPEYHKEYKQRKRRTV